MTALILPPYTPPENLPANVRETLSDLSAKVRAEVTLVEDAARVCLERGTLLGAAAYAERAEGLRTAVYILEGRIRPEPSVP